MTAFDAYKVYIGLKLHFDSGSYDYFKYHGKTRCSESTFYKSSNRFMFETFSRKYRTKEDFELFCVFNLLNNVSYIRQFSHDTYMEHKKTIESMEYIFRKDLTFLSECDIIIHNSIKVRDGQHPIILKKLLGGDITIESFVILDEILNFSPYFDKKIQEPFIWKGVSQKVNLIKPFLQPFINIIHYKQIAYDVNTNNTINTRI